MFVINSERLWLRALVWPEDQQEADDYWRAHELARKGADLGHRGARWLAAAAYDRWLMRQGKPQKYGTQYVPDGERWRLWEDDPATTDEERKEWCVPPLAEAIRRAEEMTRTRPPQIRFPAHVPPLASIEVSGLRVYVVAHSGDYESPQPEPLTPAEEPAIVPRYLPPGLTVSRLGAGNCAVRQDGEMIVFWARIPNQPPGFVYAWRWSQTAPILEPVELSRQPAVLIRGSGDGFLLLVLRSGETRWFVGAQLPESEVLRVGAGLLPE